MRLGRLASFALAATLLAGANANAATKPPALQPHKGEAVHGQPATHKFIFANAGNGWRFMLGPGHRPNAMLWFYRNHPKPSMNGAAVSITCQRATGQQAMLVAIRDKPSFPAGKDNATIAVGPVSHSLMLDVRHHSGMLILAGQGIAPGAIARAMGALPVGQQDDIEITVKGLPLIAVPVPDIRADATMAGSICAAWTKAHKKSAAP